MILIGFILVHLQVMLWAKLDNTLSNTSGRTEMVQSLDLDSYLARINYTGPRKPTYDALAANSRRPCPLSPRKRTSTSRFGMSALGQKRPNGRYLKPAFGPTRAPLFPRESYKTPGSSERLTGSKGIIGANADDVCREVRGRSKRPAW
jgi:hypothetical protein